MAGKIIKAPRGTQDILGTDSYKWQFVERLALENAGLFGFSEMRTPTFEQMDLFKRSVGDTTDVVQKEMYEVRAEKGKDLYGLKPEGTAGAVRSAIENNLLKGALPLKVCYVTPCFRHERPQAGRLREFHQFGVEMFGAQSPSADVEVICVARELFQMIGLKQVMLNINSIGCPTCRAEYHKALTEYFRQYQDKLCPTCLERLDKNPMRILDCKSPVCSEIAKGAPVVLDYLCDDCKEHFEGVKKRLDALGIEYKIDPTIVRGLDYYTKTVFEFISGDLGAQATVCGGGRYDGLVEQMGGDPTPALGFAVGLERLLLIMEAQGIEIPKPETCELFIASMGEAANIKACELTNALRSEGFYAECDLMSRSVKAQMKYANKIGAKYTMVLGDSELESGIAKLKEMETGTEREVDFRADLAQALYDITIERATEDLAEEFGGEALASAMGMKR
ncbi:histidine--tRNA ligase [Massiliimalia timonensis]|uniref:histidine--tRNA ligase n=1 Tax=Massiliimalia timonensis TaxID=1987501 RepID=UPI0018A0FDF7|nr:histidine--tRNA ligase [Massiliimalia timonensis]